MTRERLQTLDRKSVEIIGSDKQLVPSVFVQHSQVWDEEREYAILLRADAEKVMREARRDGGDGQEQEEEEEEERGIDQERNPMAKQLFGHVPDISAAYTLAKKRMITPDLGVAVALPSDYRYCPSTANAALAKLADMLLGDSELELHQACQSVESTFQDDTDKTQQLLYMVGVEDPHLRLLARPAMSLRRQVGKTSTLEGVEARGWSGFVGRPSWPLPHGFAGVGHEALVSIDGVLNKSGEESQDGSREELRNRLQASREQQTKDLKGAGKLLCCMSIFEEKVSLEVDGGVDGKVSIFKILDDEQERYAPLMEGDGEPLSRAPFALTKASEVKVELDSWKDARQRAQEEAKVQRNVYCSIE